MKKFLPLALAGVFIFICLSFTVYAQNTAGDVDADGFVRAADARIVLRAAVGLEALDKKQIAVADVDNNGIINSADARLILRAAVGLEVLHIHTYNTEIIKEATCVADGQKQYVCACSEYKEEIIPATGHQFTRLLVLPTCTQKGYTKHTCTACSYTFKDEYINQLGHKYRSVVTAPACTKKGYTTKTCEICSYQTVGDYVNAKGHLYCSAVRAPTCTEKGYTTYSCSACSDVFVSDYVNAAGHSYCGAVSVPTCTEKGYTTYSCLTCADVFISDYTDAKGHSYEISEILPSCTQEGKRIYVCLCGDNFSENISAPGHSFEGADCLVCGELNPDYVPCVEQTIVKGRITFEKTGIAVSDQGAKVLLIPTNNSVKNYDNTLALSFVAGDYESGIKVRLCDSSGSYNFSSEVPAGTYLLIAVSANSNSGFRFTDTYEWNCYVDNLLDEYFSQDEINCFKALCSYYRIFSRKIEVVADTENVINIAFDATDF